MPTAILEHPRLERHSPAAQATARAHHQCGFEGDWRNWAEIQHWASAIADALATGRSPRAAENTVSVGEPR